MPKIANPQANTKKKNQQNVKKCFNTLKPLRHCLRRNLSSSSVTMIQQKIIIIVCAVWRWHLGTKISSSGNVRWSFHYVANKEFLILKKLIEIMLFIFSGSERFMKNLNGYEAKFDDEDFSNIFLMSRERKF